MSKDFVIACLEDARKEVCERMKYRDRYLIFNLASMASIYAISHGIDIFGGKSGSQHKEVLIYSLLISLLFLFFYAAEDQVISRLNAYIASLDENQVHTADGSPEFEGRWTIVAMIARYSGMIISFLLIPCSIFLDGRSLFEDPYTLILLLHFVVIIISIGLRVQSISFFPRSRIG